MKKLIYFTLILFAIVSCNKDDNCCSEIPGDDDIFEFSIVNDSGEDRLDPSTEESLNTSSIKIYKIIEGEKIEINIQNSDYSKGYQIVQREDYFRFIPLFAHSEPDLSKGIIEWNENDSDTLTLSYTNQSGDTRRLIKVLYNDKAVWEENNDNSEQRFFKIIK